MQIFVEIGTLQAWLEQQKNNRLSVGLVPTMGALHAGHISLVQASRKDNDITVCSIFVNPTQFNNASDLDKYPRTPEADFSMLRESGCDAVFCPSVASMYEQPSQIKMDFGSLDKIFEGAFRPGHFSGVGLVVSKLFNIVQPQRAYFGQKDFQQFKIISRLVEELKFNISLIAVPIVREPDGLAMSSRNRRLNADERRRATVLFDCLKSTRAGLLRGELFSKLKSDVLRHCKQNEVRLEYLALANKHDLSELSMISEPKDAILLIAAFVGEVRLIDNLSVAETSA